MTMQTTTPRRRVWLPLAASGGAAVLLSLLPGCGGGKLSSKQGEVRLLNATTEYATLDVVSGSDGVVSGVASYAASGYAELDPGSYSFSLRSSGSGANTATAAVSVVKEGHTTLIAYTSGGVLSTSVLGEDDTAPSTGYARLRFLNTASVEAGAVDVYVVAAATACNALPSTTPAAATGVTLSASVAVEVSAASGAGTAYNLCAFATGDKTDLRVAIPKVSLVDQQIATLVLTRTKSGVLLNGLLLTQQGSLAVTRNATARVRVAASVPTAGAVTVTSAPAGGTSVALAAGLVSPGIGSYRLVAAGDLGLTVNGTAVTKSADAGSDVTLLVTGSDAASVYAVSDDNTPSTSSTNPVRLRLVNGAAGGASLTVDNAQLADSVATGAASTPVNLPATSGTSVLAVTSNGVALPPLTGQTLTSGRVYSLFLLNGNASGVPALTLRADR